MQTLDFLLVRPREFKNAKPKSVCTGLFAVTPLETGHPV